MKVLHYVDENNLAWKAPWIQLLAELGRLGAENLAVCRGGGTLAPSLRAAGIECVEYSPLAQWWPAIDRGFGRVVKRAAPDLIHTRLSSAAAVGGYWGAKYGVPVISTFDKYPKARYYVNSDVLIGCSSAVTAHIKTLRLPRARCAATILNPVLARRYRRDERVRADFRRARGAGSAVVVLGMGRFVAWKAWDDYLRAIALIPERAAFRFWLVGSGEEERRLKNLARDLGVRDRVEFFPFAEDVRPWLWAADIFVQTSREPEGFSLMLVEAMASGDVPVATNIGGTLDIVRDGENGRLFAPGDTRALAALIRGAAAPEPLARMSARAVASAAVADVRNIAAQTLELYRETLSETRRKNDENRLELR